MAKIKKPDWVENNEFDIKKVPCWVAPEPGDDGAKILTMPNIPAPLHAQAPRTIMGPTTWNHVRKKCYYDAGYKCEACGKNLGPGECQAHELYTYNYVAGTAKFERCVCLCKTCVDEDTEVLTADGWKKIPLVTTADRVACWDKDGSIKFEHPLATIVSRKEKAIKITRGDSTLYFSEDHRLPLKIASKQSPTYGEVHDVLAGDYRASHYYNWLTSGNTIGTAHLTPDERVFIAIEADGCLVWDKESVGVRASEDGKRQRVRGNRYGSKEYRYTYAVHLAKTRKIERLKQLLAESSLRYRITKETSGGYCEFNIWTNTECKHFNNCFSQEMPAEKALEFIEELVFWDGTYSRATSAWYTSKPDEVAFVQGVAAQCGIRSQVSVVNRIGNLRKGQWKTPYERLTYAVSFRSVNTELCAREMREEKIEWNKNMYCITVPTSYFIARRDNLVFVTGNCHVRGIHSGRALTMYKKGNPLMPKSALLEGAENLFRVLHEYNVAHPKEEPLRAYATFVDYAKWPELHDDMMALIKKYDVKFYQENPAFLAKWEDWKLVIGNKTYPTPYRNKLEWEIAMAANDKANQNKAIPEKEKSKIDLEVEKILGIDS